MHQRWGWRNERATSVIKLGLPRRTDLLVLGPPGETAERGEEGRHCETHGR